MRISLVLCCVLAIVSFSFSPVFGGWTETIDDSHADFSEFGSDLITVSDASAVGGSYRYIADWGDSNDLSGRVFYHLTNVPAGNHLYKLSFSSPSNTMFGTSGNITQWHIFNIAADGTESFTQNIPWAGQYGTNQQWLGTNSGYNPGAQTPVGPGPQNDASQGDGTEFWLNGSSSGGQPYIFIGYQPFYTAPMAFDAITVTEVVKLPGDVNGDGIVNSQDLAAVSSQWLQSGQNLEGDANGDGIVNSQDLAVISSNWLATSNNAAAVPEPSTVALAALGSLGCISYQWYRRRRVA